MGDRIYGVGIVGMGWVSTEHARAFNRNPHTRVVALCGRTLESATRRRDELGLDARCYDDYAAMLADPAVDIVVICTPNYLHVEQGVQAARAGKHLFIEKPAATTREGLYRLRDAIAQAGVASHVGMVVRFYPSARLARRLVEQGVLGDLFMVQGHYHHRITPKYALYRWITRRAQAGGAMLSAGTHVVDALRWLVGSEIGEVMAYGTRADPAFDYETNVVMLARFASGCVGKISVAFDVRMPYSFDLGLYGTRGTLLNDRLWSELLAEQSDWATVPVVSPNNPDVSHHPFAEEADYFVDCLRSGRPSMTDIHDAVKTHEACFAAEESMATGRPVAVAAAP